MTGERADGASLLAQAGIGLRAPHLAEVMAARPAAGWLEVHAENYMCGGPAPAALERIRRDYPISVHGVSLSVGSAEGPDDHHLGRLKRLVEQFEPALVSEHLSWCVAGGVYLNHLLPLPYTEETLALVSAHVDRAQEVLGRTILIENPSSYLRFHQSAVGEAEFLAALAKRTGCGLLCDVNNIYVTAQNFSLDPIAYLDALPAAAIGEIHLAGHQRNEVEGGVVLIDDHGSRVSEPVWSLYRGALRRFGARPTLVEWDTRLPDLEVLLSEARTADRIMAATLSQNPDVDAA